MDKDTEVSDGHRKLCMDALRKLENKAYSEVVGAFRAQGELTEDKIQFLRKLADCLEISAEVHQTEMKRVENDATLGVIADRVAGRDTGKEASSAEPGAPKSETQAGFVQGENSNPKKVAENYEDPAQVIPHAGGKPQDPKQEKEEEKSTKRSSFHSPSEIMTAAEFRRYYARKARGLAGRRGGGLVRRGGPFNAGERRSAVPYKRMKFPDRQGTVSSYLANKYQMQQLGPPRIGFGEKSSFSKGFTNVPMAQPSCSGLGVAATSREIRSETPPPTYVSSCEALYCSDEVFAACHKCEAFLCYIHFVDGGPCENGHRVVQQTQQVQGQSLEQQDQSTVGCSVLTSVDETSEPTYMLSESLRVLYSLENRELLSSMNVVQTRSSSEEESSSAGESNEDTDAGTASGSDDDNFSIVSLDDSSAQIEQTTSVVSHAMESSSNVVEQNPIFQQ